MQASVIIINPSRGMVAAKSADSDDIVIFELLGEYEVQLGDVISHPDFTSMGGETYRNVTQQQDMSVYVQNVVWTIEAAKKQCFLK